MSVWFICVGTTDLQLPVYTQDPDTLAWKLTHRTELPRPGLRRLHKQLERLAFEDLIEYISVDVPQYRAGKDEPVPRFVCVDSDDGFLAEFQSDRSGASRFRLDASSDHLPVDHQKALPLALPKVAPILGHEALRKRAPSAVIVLNTRRDSEEKEPIASGPIVAQGVARRLGLEWRVVGDPTVEPPDFQGAATSIDILIGNERFESEVDLEACRRRVLMVCKQLQEAGISDTVFLTTSGGARQIKDIVRRSLEGYFGFNSIRTLTVPETEDRVDERVLNASLDWHQRDRIRVMTAQALRQKRFTVAFGLASALVDNPDAPGPQEAWARGVQTTFAQLCSLWSQTQGREIFKNPSELLACRCEIALLQGDWGSALLQLSALFENILIDAIAGSKELQSLQFRLDRPAGALRYRESRAVDELERRAPQLFGGSRYGTNLEHRKDIKLLRLTTHATAASTWRDFILHGNPEYKGALDAFVGLYNKYSRRPKPTQGQQGLRWLRNICAHKALSRDQLDAVRRRLEECRLVVAQPDGSLSLLAHPGWTKVFSAIHPRTPKLHRYLHQHLSDLYDAVRLPGIGAEAQTSGGNSAPGPGR